MKREDLEHIIRASGVITDEYEFVIVGSQSLLGGHPYPPEVFTASAEADIYPLHAPQKADDIDGAIGEARNSMSRMVITHKASGQTPPYCLTDGCGELIRSRTMVRAAASDTV